MAVRADIFFQIFFEPFHSLLILNLSKGILHGIDRAVIIKIHLRRFQRVWIDIVDVMFLQLARDCFQNVIVGRVLKKAGKLTEPSCLTILAQKHKVPRSKSRKSTENLFSSGNAFFLLSQKQSAVISISQRKQRHRDHSIKHHDEWNLAKNEASNLIYIRNTCTIYNIRKLVRR